MWVGGCRCAGVQVCECNFVTWRSQSTRLNIYASVQACCFVKRRSQSTRQIIYAGVQACCFVRRRSQSTRLAIYDVNDDRNNMRAAFFAGMGVTVVCKAEGKQEITRAAFFAGKGVTGSIVHLTLDGVDGK